MTRYSPVQLAYICIDPGRKGTDRTPVIFLHGMMGAKENWLEIAQEASTNAKRKVYVLDARNHGDSDFTEEWNFDCNSDDLLRFMDVHDIPRAILVGHSMGGITAYKTALLAPSRVEKIFVEDMSLRRTPYTKHNMSEFLMKLIMEAIRDIPDGLDAKTALDFVVDHVCGRVPKEISHITRWHVLYHGLKQGPDGRFMATANLDVMVDKVKDLSSIMDPFQGTFEGPTWVLYGSRSHYKVDQDEGEIRSHFPNVKMVRIDGATHTLQLDCPSEHRKCLLEFLSH